MYISTFPTPIFNHISLNILNIFLMSLWLTSPFIMLFGISVHMPLYYTFSSIGHTTTPQFYHSFFFSILYSGHKIFLLFYSNTLSPIVSLLLHLIHCTLVISPLFASLSFQFYTSWQRSYYTFLTCLLRKKPCPWFSWVCIPLSSYPLQST